MGKLEEEFNTKNNQNCQTFVCSNNFSRTPISTTDSSQFEHCFGGRFHILVGFLFLVYYF